MKTIEPDWLFKDGSRLGAEQAKPSPVTSEPVEFHPRLPAGTNRGHSFGHLERGVYGSLVQS
jgi:hypothetical protein